MLVTIIFNKPIKCHKPIILLFGCSSLICRRNLCAQYAVSWCNISNSFSQFLSNSCSLDSLQSKSRSPVYSSYCSLQIVRLRGFEVLLVFNRMLVTGEKYCKSYTLPLKKKLMQTKTRCGPFWETGNLITIAKPYVIGYHNSLLFCLVNFHPKNIYVI